MKAKMKRLCAGFLALLMIFTSIPTMKAHMEEGISIAITLPEGSDNIVLDNENPVYCEEVFATITGLEKEVESIWVDYYSNIEGHNGFSLFPTEEENVYSGELTADKYEEGSYELDVVEIYYTDGTELTIEENLPTSTYFITNNITDNEGPVISDVQFSGNGETFVLDGTGEVSVTAVITDTETSVEYGNESCVTFYSTEGDIALATFELQEDGTYKATLPICWLYNNCEWYVNHITVYDVVGNSTQCVPGEYWHFFVEDENGECDTTRDNVELYFLDDNDEEIAYYEVTVEGRETTLGELLEEVPTYESELGFAGWYDYDLGILLEEDTVFPVSYSGQAFYFYPATENIEVMVDLYAIDEYGDLSWSGYEKYVIPFGTTYGELIEMLPKANTIDGIKFLGWETNCELTEVVSAYSYIDFYAVYDKQIVNVSKGLLGENGHMRWDSQTVVIEEGITYGQLLAMIDVPESVNGCNFVEWEFVSYSDEFDENEVVENDWVEVLATYDKYPVRIERAYINNKGTVTYDDVVKNYPAGTKMDDIYAEWSATPADASTEYEITAWETNYTEGETVDLYNLWMDLTALYGDKKIMTFNIEYLADYGTYGEYEVEFIYEVFDIEDCTEENLTTYCEENMVSKMTFNHYKELSMVEWTYGVYDFDEDGIVDCVYTTPKYNTYEKICLYAYSATAFRVYVVEAGETVELPTELDGYEVVWWDEMDERYDGTFEVPKSAQAGDVFFIYAVTGHKVENTEKPPVEIEDEVIDEIVKDIEDAIEDAKDNNNSSETPKVEIDMTQEDGTVATVVPEEILEAIKGEDVEVVLDMGDYTWTINGKDVKDGTLSDINLEVKVDANAIPSDKVEELAGKNTAIQLSLTHDGEFNFAATLTINVGKEYAGQYVNLYYYNEKGEFVPMTSALVDNYGNVSLVFEHASDYVMVVSDKPLAQSPITVEDVNIGMYVSVLLSGIGLAIVALKKRALD